MKRTAIGILGFLAIFIFTVNLAWSQQYIFPGPVNPYTTREIAKLRGPAPTPTPTPAPNPSVLVKESDLAGARYLSHTQGQIIVHHSSYLFVASNLTPRTFCYDVDGNPTGFFNGPTQTLVSDSNSAGGFDIADYSVGSNPAFRWDWAIGPAGWGYFSGDFTCNASTFQNLYEGAFPFGVGAITGDERNDIRQVAIVHQAEVAVFWESFTENFIGSDLFNLDLIQPVNNLFFIDSPATPGNVIISAVAGLPNTNDFAYAILDTGFPADPRGIERQNVFSGGPTTLVTNAAVTAHTGQPFSRISAITADKDKVYFYESFGADQIIAYDIAADTLTTIFTQADITDLTEGLSSSIQDMDVILDANGKATKLLLLDNASNLTGAFGAVIELPL